jgi:glycosyltransferase involved in cell wall biosynthesis
LNHTTPPQLPPPIISIGLPVYNGERFLRHALESIIEQSFSNIELIISDNASTDETANICKEFAMRDARIRYMRQAENIGAMRNWNYVAKQARGKYFKWSSASDYSAPDMLASCFDAMEADQSVILCYGQTCLVDQETGKLTEYTGNIELMEERPYERFAKLRRSLKLNNAYCGLIRTDALHRTKLNRLYSGGDIILMAELALMGRFLLLPKTLQYRRMGRETSSNDLSLSELALFLDPLKTHNIDLRLFSYHFGFLGVALSAPINSLEKSKALVLALRHVAWDRENLFAELRGALRNGFNRV